MPINHMRIRARATSSMTQPDVDVAVKHLLWCAKHQAAGQLLVQTLKPSENGGHVSDRLFWFDNRDQDLEKKLRGILQKIDGATHLVIYTPGSFKKQIAKAKYALSSRLCYVDADAGADSAKVPGPTRIVASSLSGEHWFFSLDTELEPENLQLINKALTYIAGGDHGHSPAKKFRLPGFLNLKYDPPQLVRVKHSDGPTYSTNTLLSLATEYLPGARKRRPAVVETRAASAELAHTTLARVSKKLDPDALRRIHQRSICGAFSVRLGGRLYSYPGDDRSEIIWGIGMALRRAGASQDETKAIIQQTMHWKSREADGKHEDPDYLMEKIYAANPEDDTPKPLKADPGAIAVDPAIWAGLPVPKREWLIKDWVPLKKVTVFYGDGGTGKTLLSTMLAVCCARGLPFLGLNVRQGRVYALLGENDDDDTQIGLDPICSHYNTDLGDLRGEILIASRAGFDNVLMSFRNGDGRYTKLFELLHREILAFKPTLVILETAAELFDGNENDRGQVTRFVKSCCGKIAREAGAAVILNAHPSVAGLKTGDGSAGSTAWSNSSRSRLYLRRDIDDKGKEADPDFRILERRKTNFSKVGDRIDLRWRDHVFVVDTPAENRKVFRDIEEKLIKEIERAFDAGKPYSAHHQAGHRHVVRWMCPTLKVSLSKATEIVRRLLEGGAILDVEYDSHGHRKGLATPEQAAKQQRNKNRK